MAEITARLQFETPSSFTAHDEFNQTAGALAGKTLPIGGTWSGAGDADDFTVETAGHTAQRTALSDATAQTGRLARAGTGTAAAIAVQADISSSIQASGNEILRGVFGRYVDANNWVFGGHSGLSLGDSATSFRIYRCVAGTLTELARQVVLESAMLPVAAWWTVRLGADAAGRAHLWAFRQGGHAGSPVASAHDTALATGGALASGGYGIYDACTLGIANTRNYDNFFAFVPTVDAACFASQSLEYRHDGAFRENAAGTQWAEKTVSGRNLLIPCSGAEGRTPRIIVMASRNDPDTMAHEFGSLRATLTITERYLGVPGA